MYKIIGMGIIPGEPSKDLEMGIIPGEPTKCVGNKIGMVGKNGIMTDAFDNDTDKESIVHNLSEFETIPSNVNTFETEEEYWAYMAEIQPQKQAGHFRYCDWQLEQDLTFAKAYSKIPKSYPGILGFLASLPSWLDWVVFGITAVSMIWFILTW